MPLYYTFMRKIIVSEIKSDKHYHPDSVFGQRPRLAVRGFPRLGAWFTRWVTLHIMDCSLVYSRSGNEYIYLVTKRPSVGIIIIPLKKNCVNLRKLTKEFYVRFDFGIIVTTCI